MCFRPPGAEPSLNCPECGKKVNAVLGNFPPVCPFCNADISDAIAEAKEKAAAGPGTPQAPSAPSAPSAPGAPKIPGAPKPPSQ